MPFDVAELTYETPVRGDSLAEQVYRQLATAVLSGSFAPRERISIRRLADEIRVSVTPVREAVLRLIADGVLEATEKSAIMVPKRTEAEIREIFHLRRFLEGEMAQVAAPHLEAQDVSFLAQTQANFLAALEAQNYKEALRFNSLFHFRIYRRAELPVSLKIDEGLWLRIGPTLRYMYPILHRDRSDHRRHEDIIDCAERRDPAGLRAAILGDLESSEAALNQYFGADRHEPRRRAGHRS